MRAARWALALVVLLVIPAPAQILTPILTGQTSSSPPPSYTDLCSTAALSGTCVYPMSVVHRLASTGTSAMVLQRASDSTTLTVGFVTAPNGPPAATLSGVAGMWVNRKAADNFCSGTTCNVIKVISQDGSGCDPSQSGTAQQFPYQISPVYGTPELWTSRNGATLANGLYLTTSGTGGFGGGTTDCPALKGTVPKTIIGYSNSSYPSQVGGEMGLMETLGFEHDDDGSMFAFMFCQTVSFCGPKSFGLDQENGGAWAEIPNPPGDGVGIISFSGAAATFTASMSGNTMTVSGSPAVIGTIAVGQRVVSVAPNTSPNTMITGLGTGTGGSGTYTITPAQTSGNRPMSSGLISGPLAGRNVLNIYWNGSQIVTNQNPNGPINTETRMTIGTDGDMEFVGPVWFRDLLYSNADQSANAAAISAYETNLYQTLANTKAINFISISGNGNFTAGVSGAVAGHVAPQDTPALGNFAGTLSMISSGTSWDGIACASTNGTNFQVSPNGTITTKIALSAGTYSGVCINALFGGVSYTQEFTLIATPPPANSITLTNVSGSTITNYPYQFGRPFIKGAIPLGSADCSGTGSVSNGVLTFTSSKTCATGDVVTWSGATVAAPFITTGGTGTTFPLSSMLPSTNTTTITGSAQQCPVMSINGSPATSQFDIKNRFPDGSVEFGVGAIVIPSIANNASAVVTFAPGACNNAPLTIAQMTGGSYNFDAKINMTSPAQLLGIAQNANNQCAAFAAVSNGGFAITVNGTPYNITGLNFSGVTSCPQVGAIIQRAAVALGAPVHVWTPFDAVSANPRFEIETSTSGLSSTLSYASTPSGGATDISGSGFLGWTSGAVGTGGNWLTGYVPALTGSNLTVSAKTIMQAASSGVCAAPGAPVGSNTCILWASGPVAQTVELTDESSVFAYDQGFDVGGGSIPTHKGWHPKFYVTFWPALGQFQTRYVGENDYTTTSASLNYVLTLTDGSSGPVTVYSKDLTGTGNAAGIVSSGFTSNSAIAAGATGTISFAGTPSPSLTAGSFYQMLDVNTGEWIIVSANSGGLSANLVTRGITASGSFPIAVGDTLVMGSSAIHWYGSRWTRTAWSGAAPTQQINIDGNLAYLASTRWLPNFDSSFAINQSSLATEYALYVQNPNDIYDGLWNQPTNSTSWQSAMPSTADRPDIGPYPKWTAMWINGGDWRMRAVAIGLADQASSWGLHARERATSKRYLLSDTVGSSTGLGQNISKVDRPAAFNGQWYSWGPASSNFTLPFGSFGVSPWVPDGSHQPAPFFPQYVITGDPWYVEEMNAWASVDSFGCWGGSPKNLQGCGPYNGLLATQTVYGGAFYDQLRGEGWLGRNLAEAAFAEPDGDAAKTFLTALMTENIERWEGGFQLTGTPLDGTPMKNWALSVLGAGLGNNQTANAGPFTGQVPPLHNWGSVCDPTQSNAPCGYDSVPTWLNMNIAGSETQPWQQWYDQYAIGRIGELGYPMQAVNAWSDQFPIGLINNSGYPQLVGYYLFSPLAYGSPSAGFFNTWAGLESAINLTDTCCGTPPPLGWGYSSYFNQNAATGRQTWLAPGMAMVADQDQPGGSLAWSWFNTFVYGVTQQGGYTNSGLNVWSQVPTWAIVPRADANALPAQPVIQ